MKTAIIFFLLVSYQNIDAGSILSSQADVIRINDIQTQSITNKIKALLETLKTIMKTGDSVHEIPILDPYEFKYQIVNIDSDYFSYKGSLSNISIQGLSNYDVHNIDFGTAKSNLSIDLRWSTIQGKVNYDFTGNIFMLPFYGTGDLKFELKDARFTTEAELIIDYKMNKVSIQDIDDCLISLKQGQLKFAGLYDDKLISNIISTQFSKTLPYTVHVIQKQLKSKIKKYLKVNINRVLENVSIADI